ncbi:MAG: hypothetical protein U5Q44_12505 [Dehalococcoidia bacterium]|nr:hypothetical protein [Dehalococcoidia bacterium]
MAVTYLDPTAETPTPAEPYEYFLDTSKPVTLGLIANAFPDGTRFMDKLEAALADTLPTATIRRYQKPGVLPMDDAQLAAVTSECDAAIAAWGH